MRQKYYFDDGLCIELTSFSHKRSRKDGPTKATAYLHLTKNSITETILLSVHGIDDKPEIEKSDSLEWKEYKFELKGFEYDEAVEVVVTKRKYSLFNHKFP